MISRTIPYIASGILLAIMKKTGGFSEIINFSGYRDIQLLGAIILNIVLVLAFSEVYWLMDSSAEGEHFGFDEYLDSLYFSVVSSSSTGYGEITPRSKKARIVVMIHLVLQFFILVPILVESFKPGN